MTRPYAFVLMRNFEQVSRRAGFYVSIWGQLASSAASDKPNKLSIYLFIKTIPDWHVTCLWCCDPFLGSNLFAVFLQTSSPKESIAMLKLM
jgi:hypothetical protein